MQYTTTRIAQIKQEGSARTAQVNTLQHTATNCNTHAATRCSTLQHAATHCYTLQHTPTHCNTLQHAAIRCNTPGSRCKRSQYAWDQKKYFGKIFCILAFVNIHIGICGTWKQNKMQKSKIVCSHAFWHMVHKSKMHESKNAYIWVWFFGSHTLQRTATRCSSLQLTAAHCSTWQQREPNDKNTLIQGNTPKYYC